MDKFERLKAALIDVDTQDFPAHKQGDYYAAKTRILDMIRKREAKVADALKLASIEDLEAELAERRKPKSEPLLDGQLWGFKVVDEDTLEPPDPDSVESPTGIVAREEFFVIGNDDGTVYGVDSYDRIYPLQGLIAIRVDGQS